MEDLILFTEFDEAFVGTTYRNGELLAVYDYEIMVALLIKDGMTEEDAIEYIDYNVLGAWFGDKTPIVVYPQFLEDL